MKIRIILGNDLDGSIWNKSKAEIGKLKLGPNGFLNFLEGRLGLSGSFASRAERVGIYRLKYETWLDKKESSGKDAADLFAARSFKTDSWSTAKILLALRDELVEGGWNKNGGGGERISTLAEIESAGPELPLGTADRLRVVLEYLQSGTDSREIPIELQLHEPSELFLPIWRQIFDELKKRSISVQEPDSIFGNFEKNIENLDIEVITGSTEIELAPQLARFLCAGSDEDNSSVTLLCQGDSHYLDGILHRYGFGGVGNSASSPYRPSLSILSLYLEMIWEPFRPDIFVDLLLHPYSPVPSSVRWSLSRALSKEPGKGEEWDNAWKKGEEPYSDETEESRLDRVEKLAKWRQLFETQFDPDQGIPGQRLADRLALLQSYLKVRSEKSPELCDSLFLAGRLKEMIKDSGKAKITRVELSHILDILVGTGNAPADSFREVTPFHIITSPGMMTDKTETLLWYNFIEEEEKRGTQWSNAEKDFFEKNGVKIDAVLRRKLKEYQWKSLFAGVQNRAILFLPRLIAGEEVYEHPFINDLAAAKQPNEKEIKPEKLMIEADSLLTPNESDEAALWSLGGRNLVLKETSLFEKKTIGSGDNGVEYKAQTAIEIPLPLYPTTVTKILRCPYQWVVEEYLGICNNYPPNVLTGRLLYGNLVHKIYEELFKVLPLPEPDTVQKKVEDLFKDYVPKIAAELNFPENRVQRGNILSRIADSAVFLTKQFRQWDPVKIETEAKISKDNGFAGLPIGGRTDFVAEESNGMKHIIDYKWSYSNDYGDQKNLKHLQLAFYSFLFGGEIEASFYLVPRKKWSKWDSNVFQEIWREAEERTRTILSELAEGKIGFGDDSNNTIFKAECGYCKLQSICGKAGGKN